MAKMTKGQTPKNLIIQNTTITQVQRGSADIGKWRTAQRSAESTTNPNRTQLYDLYADVELDDQIISSQVKRKTEILKKKIVFVRNGKPDENVMEQIKSAWFFNFMNELLDTVSHGNSVFQFYREGNWIKYDMIPRKNVKPEKKIFVTNQNDSNGISYIDNPEFPNVLEVNYFLKFGLLMYAAPYVIYKRNGLGDFAEFAETYGQPIREGIYDGYDEEVRKKLVADLTAAGRSCVFVHPEGTKVNIIDSPFKASSTGIYDKLIEVCDNAISKIYLSNTLTTQQGQNGARSLGEVHKEGEEAINITDEIWLTNILNYDMADIFANLGINTKGGEFQLIDKQSIDLKTKIDIDTKVANQVPIDDDYWYETYGIRKPVNYDELKAQKLAEKQSQNKPQPPDPNAKPGAAGTNAQNKNKGFFRFFA
jgi:phage gp29-like protein